MPTTYHEDDIRGYRVVRQVTLVAAQQVGGLNVERYIAFNPKTQTIVEQAQSLQALEKKLRSQPLAYVHVNGGLIEIVNEDATCMGTKQLKAHCDLSDGCLPLMKLAMDELGLSARAYDKVRRIARTSRTSKGS